MQSFRSRMNTVLRRPSFSGKSDQSGSESDAPSRKSSGDKETKKPHRKRVSFSPRSRSGTADTFEQSQLARQVVDATSLDKPASLSDAKPEGVAAELPLDSSVEYTKVESPTKDSCEQPTEQVIAKEEPVQAIEPVEVKEEVIPVHSEEPPVEPQVEQVVAPVVEVAPLEQHEYSKQTVQEEVSQPTYQAQVTHETK